MVISPAFLFFAVFAVFVVFVACVCIQDALNNHIGALNKTPLIFFQTHVWQSLQESTATITFLAKNCELRAQQT
jgi:hypothetical protein